MHIPWTMDHTECCCQFEAIPALHTIAFRFGHRNAALPNKRTAANNAVVIVVCIFFGCLLNVCLFESCKKKHNEKQNIWSTLMRTLDGVVIWPLQKSTQKSHCTMQKHGSCKGERKTILLWFSRSQLSCLFSIHCHDDGRYSKYSSISLITALACTTHKSRKTWNE